MEFTSLLQNTVFCALDCETTGLNPIIDRIVSIGLIQFTLHGVVRSFYTLVDPLKQIPSHVTNIHGITTQKVKGAPTIDELFDIIQLFTQNSYCVIHNPRFDIAFINSAFHHFNKEMPELQAFDTVKLAKKAFKGLPSYNLGNLCRYFGLHIYEHHALSDAQGSMELFKKVIETLHAQNWCIRDLARYHGGLITPDTITMRSHNTPVDSRIPLGYKINITYKDIAGNVVRRSILPQRYFAMGRNNYIQAYCYLRKEVRYFNTARILSVG